MDISPERLEELTIMPYEEYLLTPEWKERRDAALERTEHRCQICNSPHQLNAHHRTYLRRGNEPPADLTVLCQSCHTGNHTRMTNATSGFSVIGEFLGEYVELIDKLHEKKLP